MADIPAYRNLTLAAGIATLALATWLLYLNPSNRLHRAFALFLLLKGGIYALTPFVPSVFSWQGRSLDYLVLALPFAGVHLVHRLGDCFLMGGPSRRRAAGRWLGWTLLAGVALVEVLYFVDHSLLYGGTPGAPTFGPFYFFQPLAYATFAAVSLALAVRSRPLVDATGRRALAVGAVAFAIEPLYWSSQFLAAYAFSGLPGTGSDLVEPAIEAGTFLLAAASLAALLAPGGGLAGRGHAWAAALSGAAVASGAFVAAVDAYAPWQDRHVYALLYGLDAFWHLALVALTAAAVLRHRFLAMESQVRFSLQQGTVAAVFVAVFFVVSESAQLKFGESLKSQYLGTIAAGLLLFAIVPLQRLAERLVSAAVPHQSIERMAAPQRQELFREQCRFAWNDGTLTRLERRRLDHLRDRLGLDLEEAARIESEAAAEVAVVPRKGREAARSRAPA